MTTGKNIDLTRLTFLAKIICLLLNMLSRFVIAFFFFFFNCFAVGGGELFESRLEDRKAWCVAVHGIAKSGTRLGD